MQDTEAGILRTNEKSWRRRQSGRKEPSDELACRPDPLSRASTLEDTATETLKLKSRQTKRINTDEVPRTMGQHQVCNTHTHDKKAKRTPKLMPDTNPHAEERQAGSQAHIAPSNYRKSKIKILEEARGNKHMT